MVEKATLKQKFILLVEKATLMTEKSIPMAEKAILTLQVVNFEKSGLKWINSM